MKWIVWAESTCYGCRQTAGMTWCARRQFRGRDVYRCATAPVVVEAETRREAIRMAREGRLHKFAGR